MWDIRPFAPPQRCMKVFSGHSHNFEKVGRRPTFYDPIWRMERIMNRKSITIKYMNVNILESIALFVVTGWWTGVVWIGRSFRIRLGRCKQTHPLQTARSSGFGQPDRFPPQRTDPLVLPILPSAFTVLLRYSVTIVNNLISLDFWFCIGAPSSIFIFNFSHVCWQR